jgi:hypothetical protein
VVAAYFNWRNHEGPGANDCPQAARRDDHVRLGVYAVKGGNEYGDSKLLDKYLNRSGVRKEDDLPKIEDWNPSSRNGCAARSTATRSRSCTTALPRLPAADLSPTRRSRCRA